MSTTCWPCVNHFEVGPLVNDTLRPVKAVLFDLDGTLIDSATELAHAVNHMRTARSLPPLPLEAYRPYVGSGARGLLPIGLNVGEGHPDFAKLREEFFDTYEKCIGAATLPFDGVALLLQKISLAALPWGIVTNKVERFAVPIVQKTTALAQCGTLIGGDTTAYSKPRPEPLLEAAARLGIDPRDCVYVGDDLRDMQAGQTAGMQTVAALYGYIAPDEDTRTWPATATIETPLQLTQLLRID